MSRGQVARGPLPNAQVEQVITKPLEEAPPNHDPPLVDPVHGPGHRLESDRHLADLAGLGLKPHLTDRPISSSD
jgi:hypothetical protein